MRLRLIYLTRSRLPHIHQRCEAVVPYVTDMLLGFIIQLAGFYILYSTSARAAFVKRKHNIYLYRHRTFSKVLGSSMLLASLAMFMMQMGTAVGFLFALTSLMTISGFIIILFPLRKT